MANKLEILFEGQEQVLTFLVLIVYKIINTLLTVANAVGKTLFFYFIIYKIKKENIQITKSDTCFI